MTSTTVAESVSVVVAVRNRQDVMQRCLRAIRGAGATDIVVVDGMSRDRTATIASQESVRILTDGGRGLAAARQLGATNALRPWVVFVDSDAVVKPDTLQNLVDDARENGFDALQAVLLPLPGSTSYWQRGEAWRRRAQEEPGPATVVGCQATLVKRALVLDIRFDAVFSGAGEDGDFFRRAAAAGARVGVSSLAIAYHEDRRGLLDFARQRYWHGRGLARTAFRYGSRYRQAFLKSARGLSTSTRNDPPRQVLNFLPFLFVSSLCLGWGMALETVRIVSDPSLRRRLRGNAA